MKHSVSISYRVLFRVNVLHYYLLNKGINQFTAMAVTEQKSQLKEYDILSFLSVAPTEETQKKLDGHHLFFKTFGSGFNLLSRVISTNKQEPFINLNDDLSLTFLIKLTDEKFYNYTNLNLNNSNKIYYLSNERLDTEPETFPLINLSGNNNPINENYILPQDGIDNELSLLNSVEKNNLFSIVRIFMKSTDTTLSVTDGAGGIPISYTAFEIILENRSTFWRYIYPDDQTVTSIDDVQIEGSDPKVLITKNGLPLTKSGFISVNHGDKELPNPKTNIIKPDKTIYNKNYSEIYM